MEGFTNYFQTSSLCDKSLILIKMWGLYDQINICSYLLGKTEEQDTGEGVGQGTLEGALVSGVNLYKGVNEYFKDSEYEVSYGPTFFKDLLRYLLAREGVYAQVAVPA